jgi:hypothetical protein
VLLIFKKYINEIIMDNIIEPSKNFDFSKLSLAHPVGIQGGAYFTKILNNNKPLYIQTTKSLTRQGFVKSGKKYYCDLMFDNNSEILVNWFENLQETCQNLIFDKSEAWFQNSLEKSDVESAFNSIIRLYKSGKFYLVRTNIKIGTNNEPNVKIYDENEIPLSIDDIKEETNIISILEIQGIKFTSRNFQIDVELRQVMVLDNEPLFDNCLIKTNNSKKNTNLNSISNEVQNLMNENQKSLEKEVSLIELNKFELTDEDIHLGSEIKDNNIIQQQTQEQEEVEEAKKSKEFNFDIEMEDSSEQLDVKELEDNTELKELDLNVTLEDDLESLGNETLILKKPNEVYYELYKEAREKAKLAKKTAIIAYLEAKNIKKTYMLDSLDESESDIDAEIDEVSESELEGL